MQKFALVVLVSLICFVLILGCSTRVVVEVPLESGSPDDGGLYPLDFTMQVCPEEIRYGDVCFLTFSITNKGQEILYLPVGVKYSNYTGSMYYYLGKEKVLIYDRAFNHFESTMPDTIHSGRATDIRPIKPGETMKFHFRLAWFPLPEFAHSEQSKALLKRVNQGESNYKILIHLPSRDARFHTYWIRFSREGITNYFVNRQDFIDRGYYLEDFAELESSIRILPRPEEEIQLLKEWYLELPATDSLTGWMHFRHVFAHLHHVRDSLYKMEAPTTLELEEKRYPFSKAHHEFYVSMHTRTPESITRIERTNELATKILERAKQPNSTISQNMVEFIQLRGFLVDMRYAENAEAETAAFDKLVNFVENAKDKELWLIFLDEVGFNSIYNRTHYTTPHLYFPWEKVEEYRKLFAKHFAEDFNKIGGTIRP